MQSKTATVREYLASLPDERRRAVEAVREVILRNLDQGYEEGMQYGVIGYYVPHRLYPAGYAADPKQGLPFAALASQKNYMSVHLMGLYCGCADGTDATALVRWFHDAWKKSGKKLDMGKACIRFRKVDDLALDVLGEAIRRLPASAYIEQYERAKQRRPSASQAAGAQERPRRAASRRSASRTSGVSRGARSQRRSRDS
jgi:uncharacterized protein DUF1801